MTLDRENELKDNIVTSSIKDRFVDRENELNKLNSLLEKVKTEQRPYYAFVHSQPGIGKTATLEHFLEIQRTKRGNDLRIFHIKASEGINTPLYPFASAMESFVKENLNIPDKVRRIAPALIECIPGIGSNARNLVKVIESLQSPPRIEMHETEQSATYSKYLETIESISKNKVLIFCIDDAQWLDTSSRMLLEIISGIIDASILFVISARSQSDIKHRTNLDALNRIQEKAGKRSCEIEIKPFVEEWYPELIKNFRNKCMTPENIHKIYETTKGNPYWLDKVLSGSIDDAQIPTKIFKALDDQLDDVYVNVPKSQKALRYAAVLGSQFDLDTISGLLGMEREETFQMLEQLQKYGLIKNPGGQEYYTFEHDITREHVYESLRVLRQDYHKDVAEFLKQCGGNYANPYALAYHYLHAECNREALKYMRVAARTSDGFLLDSVKRLEECLEIAQEMSMPREEIASIKLDYARALLDLKQVKNNIGTQVPPTPELTHIKVDTKHVKDSMGILEELINDEHTPRQEKAISHVLMSRCYRIIEVCESGVKSISHAETAISMLHKDESKLLGDAYAYLATVYDHFDADEAKTRYAFKEAGRCYQGFEIELACLHRKAGMVMEARRAIEEMTKSLKVFKERNIKLESARCLNNMGAEYLYVGDFQRSMKCLCKSITEFETIGTHEIDIPCNNLGVCYLQNEDYEKAMQYFEKALDKVDEIYKTVFIKMNISTAHRKMGHPHEAMAILKELEKVVLDLPEPTLQDYYGFNRGIVHRDLREWSEALEWIYKFQVNTYKDDVALARAKRIRALSEIYSMQGGAKDISNKERTEMKEAFATTRPQKWMYKTDYYPCDIHIWS